MKFLVLGDVHGEFDRMVELQKRVDPDVCFQVGDLEPVRNESDLEELTGPSKYNEIRDYPAYESGKRSIPTPTWFIGGNHEPWSYLYEHNPDHQDHETHDGNEDHPGEDSSPGNELVPNLYYLGRFGVQTIQGLTMAYLTGVYGESSYETPSEKRLHHAKGLDWQKNKRNGHFREDEVQRLLEEAGDRDIDLLMTHDWPRVTDFKKPVDRQIMDYGNRPLSELARLIEPTVYAAGHMHFYLENQIGSIPFHGLGRVNAETDQNPGIVLDETGRILETVSADESK